MAGRVAAVVRHPVTQNAIALYATQFVLTALPLITLPWMARALGPAELGRVLFAQSFSFLVVILVEYGFNLSAAREVARERADPDALGRTVAGVLAAKLTLAGVAVVIALVALALVPQFRDDPRLLIFGVAMGVSQGLLPLWYFVGVERMRVSAAVDVTTRLLTAAAIVALVHHPGDGIRVLWIWTVGNAASTAMLSIVMYRAVPFRRPTAAERMVAFRGGAALFVTTAAVSLYTSATVVLLGLVVTSAQLALFASAERVVRAALRATSPIAQSTYPRVNFLLKSGREDRAQRLSTVTLGAVFTVGVLTAAAIFVLAPALVHELFGHRFEGTIGIMRVLALLVPAVALAASLSGQWLLPRGLDRVNTRVALAAGLANVVLTLVVGSLAGVSGVAWVLVGIEFGVAAAYATAIHRRGLFPTREQLRRGAA